MATTYAGDNEDRIRRANSWARIAKGNDAITFLLMWIAFNAAYGRDVGPNENKTEYETFRAFIQRVIEKDKKRGLRQYLVEELDLIERLLNNKYIYQPFWHSVRDRSIIYSIRKPRGGYVRAAWRRGETAPMLEEVMRRLYTLRNQIMHGGTTYGEESWGKKQLRDGAKFMAGVVPKIIEIMATDIATNPATPYWGPVSYPRFRDSEDPSQAG